MKRQIIVQLVHECDEGDKCPLAFLERQVVWRVLGASAHGHAPGAVLNLAIVNDDTTRSHENNLHCAIECAHDAAAGLTSLLGDIRG